MRLKKYLNTLCLLTWLYVMEKSANLSRKSSKKNFPRIFFSLNFVDLNFPEIFFSLKFFNVNWRLKKYLNTLCLLTWLYDMGRSANLSRNKIELKLALKLFFPFFLKFFIKIWGSKITWKPCVFSLGFTLWEKALICQEKNPKKFSQKFFFSLNFFNFNFPKIFFSLNFFNVNLSLKIYLNRVSSHLALRYGKKP